MSIKFLGRDGVNCARGFELFDLQHGQFCRGAESCFTYTRNQRQGSGYLFPGGKCHQWTDRDPCAKQFFNTQCRRNSNFLCNTCRRKGDSENRRSIAHTHITRITLSYTVSHPGCTKQTQSNRDSDSERRAKG